MEQAGVLRRDHAAGVRGGRRFSSGPAAASRHVRGPVRERCRGDDARPADCRRVGRTFFLPHGARILRGRGRARRAAVSRSAEGLRVLAGRHVLRASAVGRAHTGRLSRAGSSAAEGCADARVSVRGVCAVAAAARNTSAVDERDQRRTAVSRDVSERAVFAVHADRRDRPAAACHRRRRHVAPDGRRARHVPLPARDRSLTIGGGVWRHHVSAEFVPAGVARTSPCRRSAVAAVDAARR